MRNTNLRPLVVREIERIIGREAGVLSQRFGLQPADEADLRQEGWVRALDSRGPYRKRDGTLGTYLTPRVYFAMLDAVMRLRDPPDAIDITATWEADIEADMDDAESLAETLEDPTQEIALEAAVDAMGALERLGTRERNLLVLYFGLSGKAPLTLAELAARNRQPISVIYRRIQRGLEMLKDDLEQQDSIEE